MAAEEASSSFLWSREEDKAFEIAIADYPDICNDLWERIAALVPAKPMNEIKHHYDMLLEDIAAIESGRVPLPNYTSTSEGSADRGRKGGHSGNSCGEPILGGSASKIDQERRKGIAWTEEEHRLFLLGLDKYGKGDWRSISRNYVVSRTPTQVASHAQKYFIRQSSLNKERRRTSIHDITTVEAGDLSADQGPIIGGQTDGPGATPGKFIKQSSQPPTGPPGVGVFYGTAISQPLAGPLISAVGTPVNLPVPAAPHMAYGMRAPVSGLMVAGAPVNLAPMAYPMPRTSARR